MSLDGPHDLIFRHAGEQGLECDPRLEPRERRAEAEMDPLAERDVAQRGPSELKRVGVGIPALVAVGRCPEQQHALPLRDSDAAELDVARRHPRPRLHGREIAQELLDRVRDPGQIVREGHAVGGPVLEQHERVCDQRRRRVDARQEEEPAHAVDLVHRQAALAVRRRDRAEEVTAGRAQPLGHGGDDVLAHLARRPFGDLGHLGSARLAVQHVRVPPLELGVVLGRGSEQVADDRHGQPPGELVDEVHPPALDERRDQRVDLRRDEGLEPAQARRGEVGMEDLPQLVVAGRVGVQEAPRAEPRVVDVDALRTRERAPVAPAALNVVEPREHPDRPLAVHVDRRLVPQAAVDRIGVLVEEERVVLNHAATPAGGPGPTTVRPAPRCGSGPSEARFGSSGRAGGRLPRRRTR